MDFQMQNPKLTPRRKQMRMETETLMLKQTDLEIVKVMQKG